MTGDAKSQDRVNSERIHAFLLRFAGALLLVALYACAYFPFALFAQPFTGSHWLPKAFIVLTLLSAGLVICRLRLRPRTLAGQIVFWTCAISAAASWLGLGLLVVPQTGHPSIGIFFFIVPLGLNTILIPVALVSLLTGLIQREKPALIAGGFIFLLAATFFFSSFHYLVPAALDKISGTDWFSKMLRRYRVDPREEYLPGWNEMLQDIALIKKGPLDSHKLYHLETTAWKAPQYCGPIIDEMIDEFPAVKDFETRRRVLMQIKDLSVYFPQPPVCRHDLPQFYSQIVERREADLSDIAAMALTSHEFQKILTQDKYRGAVHGVAQYALERQVHTAPKEIRFGGTNYLSHPNAPWFMYRSLNCVGPVAAAVSNLIQQAELSATDRQAMTNLLLFVPYLKARAGDAAEFQPYVRQECEEALSRLNHLEQRVRN